MTREELLAVATREAAIVPRCDCECNCVGPTECNAHVIHALAVAYLALLLGDTEVDFNQESKCAHDWQRFDALHMCCSKCGDYGVNMSGNSA